MHAAAMLTVADLFAKRARRSPARRRSATA